MPLEMVEDGCLAGINNLYNGQKIPELLGLKGLSAQMGPFFIGFDTRIKPAVVRIFFDPAKWVDPLPGVVKEIGLVQVGEARYNGIPIEPGRYAKELKYLNFYDNFGGGWGQNAYWMDMVSADVTKATKAYAQGAVFPFFQLNGALSDVAGTSYEGYFVYPRPNGNLSYWPPLSNDRFCRGTWLVSPIGLDFDGPYEDALVKNVERYTKHKIKKAASRPVSQAELQSKGMVGVALEMLELKNAQIVWVQVAGEHVLIKVDNLDGYCPYLCAYLDATGKELNVYLLDRYEMEEKQLDKLEYLLKKFIAFRNGYMLDDFKGLPRYNYYFDQKEKRGKTSWKPEFFSDKTVSPAVEFRYRTYAVMIYTDPEIKQIRWWPIGGVEWGVGRWLDVTQMCLGPLLVCRPREIHADANSLINDIKPLWDKYINVLYNSEPPEGEPGQKIWFMNPGGKYAVNTEGYGQYSTKWYEEVKT